MRLDWYRSPAWTLLRLREKLALPQHAAAKYIEPGAGDGILIRAFDTWQERRRLPRPSWDAYEIDEQHRRMLDTTGARVVISDFLLSVALGSFRYDVALGNPSYELAEPVFRHCRAMARQVALLLPLDFLGSAERQAMFASDMPDVYVLPQRPTFVVVNKLDERGKETTTSSDAQVYGWFHWPEQRRPRGELVMLGLTPADVISAARAAAPQVWIEQGEIVRVDPGDPFYIGR
jgi:hypothetical protein